MSKHPYLISNYGYYSCSECGVRYSEEEYMNYYCLDKIMFNHINCKKCGAVFTEQPKRCYWDEHHPEIGNACGDSFTVNDVCYCTRQLTARREELRSWGCYYSCEAMKPKENFEQLSFF